LNIAEPWSWFTSPTSLIANAKESAPIGWKFVLGIKFSTEATIGI
jgi:hypothetical protein